MDEEIEYERLQEGLADMAEFDEDPLLNLSDQDWEELVSSEEYEQSVLADNLAGINAAISELELALSILYEQREELCPGGIRDNPLC